MTKTYLDAQCPILNQKGRNIGYIWNFYGRIDCPTTVDFGSDTDELAYFRVKSAATSGDLIAVKGRTESDAVTGTTMNINALQGEAVVNASAFAVTVRGIYTDAMVKASATCTSVRGGDFNTSIYAGATITNCEGLRVVVGHPSAAVSISGVDTLLHLVLDGSNNHVAKSAIDIDCQSGTTLTTGIDIGDSCVTAIDIGACTTGILLDSAMTDAIKISGASTDGIEISGVMTNAINITNANTGKSLVIATNFSGSGEKRAIDITWVTATTYGSGGDRWGGSGTMEAMHLVTGTVSGAGSHIAEYINISYSATAGASFDIASGLYVAMTYAATETTGILNAITAHIRNPDQDISGANEQCVALRACIYTGASGETQHQTGILVSILDSTTTKSNAQDVTGIKIQLNVANNSGGGNMQGIVLDNPGTVSADAGIWFNTSKFTYAFTFTDDGVSPAPASDGGTATGSQLGVIKVRVGGGSVRYIPLYDGYTA